MSIDEIIALRLQQLRKQQGLSIELLANKSAVSKAMISKIERQQSSPSATILGRLAAGLGVPIAQLIAFPGSEEGPLRRRTEQALWQDPQLGYLRRQVCERDEKTGLEMVEIELPIAARVSYPRWSSTPYRQRLWLLEGSLQVDYGEQLFCLQTGDCLTFAVDAPLTFTNDGQQACRYLLVMTSL